MKKAYCPPLFEPSGTVDKKSCSALDGIPGIMPGLNQNLVPKPVERELRKDECLHHNSRATPPDAKAS